MRIEEIKNGKSYEKFLTKEFLTYIDGIVSEFKNNPENTLKNYKEFFKEITEVIFSLNLTEDEILKVWEKILLEKINSGNDIRAIALNHFLNLNIIENPKVLELERFVRLINAALRDLKTNTYNYTALKVLLDYEIERNKRYGGNFSILMVDLDNFKYYNDTYGHQFGDEILNNFIVYASSCLRKSDMIFRYGGDEFIVFLPETRRIGARVVAEKIKDITLEKFSERKIEISASIGIAVFPYDGETYEQLIEFADKMLYASKERGKNIITDKFDFTNPHDERKYPRFTKNFELTLNYNHQKIKCLGVNISKSGMLIKQVYPIIQNKDETIELEELKIGQSTYILKIPTKLKRIEEELLAIDFSENPTLQTLIYLFEGE